MLSGSLTEPRCVVIGDLVGSRAAPDRGELQRLLRGALDTANAHCASVEPLVPTVGDEVQGVYDNVWSALDATLLVRVGLPVPYDVRFGIGIGAVTWVEDEPGSGFRRQDGPAWWAARDAVDHVATAGRRRDVPRTLRTWAAEALDADPRARLYQDVTISREPRVQAVNAYLVVRDYVVSRMDARDRRILGHLILGRAISEIAGAEGITSSAVSQRVQRSGADEIMYSRDQLMRAYFGREGDTWPRSESRSPS